MLLSFRLLSIERAAQLCNLMGFRTSCIEYMAVFKNGGPYLASLLKRTIILALNKILIIAIYKIDL
jgi:hypothetical protein